jgi:hypothetical protein
MTDSLTLPGPFPAGAPAAGAPAAGDPMATHPGGLHRLLPAGGAVPVDLRAHLDQYGALPHPDGPGRIVAEVEAAGLTGRGGAAFPAYRKLAAVAGCEPAPLVVGNGAEGEPASSKDSSLLWICPHLVLDGLQVAAQVAGSRAAALYVPRRRPLHQRLAQAIAERAAAGMDIARVELRAAPDRFLAGESPRWPGVRAATRAAIPRCGRRTGPGKLSGAE